MSVTVSESSRNQPCVSSSVSLLAVASSTFLPTLAPTARQYSVSGRPRSYASRSAQYAGSNASVAAPSVRARSGRAPVRLLMTSP